MSRYDRLSASASFCTYIQRACLVFVLYSVCLFSFSLTHYLVCLFSFSLCIYLVRMFSFSLVQICLIRMFSCYLVCSSHVGFWACQCSSLAQKVVGDTVIDILWEFHFECFLCGILQQSYALKSLPFWVVFCGIGFLL